VGELHDAGKTIMHFQAGKRFEEQVDELLEGVRQMAADDFEVFGEIGRGDNSTIIYLARDKTEFKLVALKLSPSRMDPNEFVLDVVNELDSTLPSFDNPCDKCGTRLHRWGRFCPKCGADLYDKAEQKWTAEELREAVQEFATNRFEILGEMQTQGGGRIYFARDIESGKVGALRLQKQSEDEFNLGFTGILKPVVASVVGKARPSIGRTGPYPTIDRSHLKQSKPVTAAPSQSSLAPSRPASAKSQPVRPPPSREAPRAQRSLPPRQPTAAEDPWAPLRSYIQHPVVLTVLLACLVLVLLIILALVT
jgi:hypothetical protein